jgi:uncharacterized membrane protein
MSLSSPIPLSSSFLHLLLLYFLLLLFLLLLFPLISLTGGWQLSEECTVVDAVVNTIGFPLVGEREERRKRREGARGRKNDTVSLLHYNSHAPTRTFTHTHTHPHTHGHSYTMEIFPMTSTEENSKDRK